MNPLAPALLAASAAILMLLGLVHLPCTALLVSDVVLGGVYWFSSPFRGIVAPTALYVCALVIAWT
jgi:hypothetical protein